MEDKEIKRLFTSWSDMNTRTVVALNDVIRRVERLEEAIRSLVTTFKAPREGLHDE
ncbi:MAG: hypothetical protein V3V81_08230 [Candidatus Bathyarchaeia archaeon]